MTLFQWSCLLSGSALALFTVFNRYAAYRFRKRALKVSGEVLEVMPGSKYCSHYLVYTLDGKSRCAEYCSPTPWPEFEVGEVLEVLIDPKAPPNTPIPKSGGLRSTVRTGDCLLPNDNPKATFQDVLQVMFALVLLAMARWLP